MGPENYDAEDTFGLGNPPAADPLTKAEMDDDEVEDTDEDLDDDDDDEEDEDDDEEDE